MRLMIPVVASLLCGCARTPEPAATAEQLEQSLFSLTTEQLFQHGITEVTQGVEQTSWMLANMGPGDDGRSGTELAALFKEHNIPWFGSAGHGFMAVYVSKADFPRAQVMLSQLKKNKRLKLLVWHPGQTKEDVDKWMSNNVIEPTR